MKRTSMIDRLYGVRINEDPKRDLSHIAVTTSSLTEKFFVIDSISALSSQDAGFKGVDLNAIFEHVKEKLREQCDNLGGDAVISCHFSERSAHSGGLLPTQVIEIWAYGTAVKLATNDGEQVG